MCDQAAKAIADVEAGRQVVCTIEEYLTTVRMGLQRHAMYQAAQGRPDLVAQITAEVKRLDTAQNEGWWPGAYGSVWERLFVRMSRRYAIRTLIRRYYRRAHGPLPSHSRAAGDPLPLNSDRSPDGMSG